MFGIPTFMEGRVNSSYGEEVVLARGVSSCMICSVFQQGKRPFYCKQLLPIGCTAMLVFNMRALNFHFAASSSYFPLVLVHPVTLPYAVSWVMCPKSLHFPMISPYLISWWLDDSSAIQAWQFITSNYLLRTSHDKSWCSSPQPFICWSSESENWTTAT